jgi:hypothetical protein
MNEKAVFGGLPAESLVLLGLLFAKAVGICPGKGIFPPMGLGAKWTCRQERQKGERRLRGLAHPLISNIHYTFVG